PIVKPSHMWSRPSGSCASFRRLTIRSNRPIDLRMGARMCLGPLGEFVRVRDLCLKAVPMAEALNDPRRESLVHSMVTSALGHMGQSDEAIAHGERALAIAEALPDPMLRIAAKHPLGLVHRFLGAYRTATRYLQCNVGIEREQINARLLQVRGNSA